MKTRLYNTPSPILQSVKRSEVTRWKQGYIRTLPILHCISQLGENKGGRGHWVSQNNTVLVGPTKVLGRRSCFRVSSRVIALQITQDKTTAWPFKPPWCIKASFGISEEWLNFLKPSGFRIKYFMERFKKYQYIFSFVTHLKSSSFITSPELR